MLICVLILIQINIVVLSVWFVYMCFASMIPLVGVFLGTFNVISSSYFIATYWK